MRGRALRARAQCGSTATAASCSRACRDRPLGCLYASTSGMRDAARNPLPVVVLQQIARHRRRLQRLRPDAADGVLEARLYRVWPGNAHRRAGATSRSPQDEWQHVAVAYDGSSRAAGLRLYLDGVELADRGRSATAFRRASASAPYGDGRVDAWRSDFAIAAFKDGADRRAAGLSAAR